MRFDRLITAVDAHAAGEPGRVITGGVLDVPGATMLDKMAHLRDHADELRKLMLREPRGYPAANCNLILPPTIPGADAGYVIMEQVEYPAMSGSNTICVVTVLIETGMVAVVEPVTTLRLESPAGLIEVKAEVRDGRVLSVTFRNVPAFAVHLDAIVEVPHLGSVTVDVAWGGMFYVIADAERFGLRITPDEARDIVRIGEMVKLATQEQLPVRHPENPDLTTGVTISQISGKAHAAGSARRNAVIVSTGQATWDRPESWTGAIDRSPCGTGTSAKMACEHARGRLALNEDFVHEGILGTTFTGRLVAEAKVRDRPAVIPTITGRAWITGFANYVVAPDDPFPTGYTLTDIWATADGAT